MPIPRYLLVAIVATGIVVPICWAQQPGGLEPVTRVITLHHVSSDMAVDAIMTLDFDVAVSDVGRGTLLVRGRPNQIEDLTALLAEIDVPDQDVDAQGYTVEIIPINNYPIDKIEELIYTVASGNRTRVAVDERGRKLIVRAAADEMPAIRALIEEVDRPSQSLTVTFYFVRATIGGAPGTSAGWLPALDPVAATLNENGYGGLGLMATVMITVDEGRDFSNDSLLRTPGDGDSQDELSVYVYGEADLQAGNNMVQIDLQARVEGDYASEGDSGSTQFEVSTTVATALGNYVILAAAPSSTSSGNAVALVARVTTAH